MIVVGKDAAAPTHHSIERLRDADGEALDALAEGFAAVGLDDQVQVISQHDEFDQAQSESAP